MQAVGLLAKDASYKYTCSSTFFTMKKWIIAAPTCEKYLRLGRWTVEYSDGRLCGKDDLLYIYRRLSMSVAKYTSGRNDSLL